MPDLPPARDRIAELGEGAVNMAHLSCNVLAGPKVLYKGHAVAAVAADNVHIAQEAAKLIKVDYEPLPPVLDVRKAMEDDAPVLNEDVKTEEFGEIIGMQPSNVAKRLFFEQGDPDKAFEEAAVVVEREFHTATVHQGYIEPHTATAVAHGDGKLTIYTSTQGSFTVRQQVAELLEMPVTNIKVVPMEIGGGFGGKISVYLQPVAALLSIKTGHPVKLTMDRADVLEATGPTPGSYMRVKLGADKDGKLIAGDAYLAYEAGAYPGSPIGPGCLCVFSCYDIPNARVEGYDVCVNKPRTNAYRAPGSTQAAFAVETVLEELCEKLDKCSTDFRLENAAKEGTRRVDGVVYPVIGMYETVEAIKKSEHYKSDINSTPSYGLHGSTNGQKFPRGRGIASGFWFNAGLKSSATVTVNAGWQGLADRRLDRHWRLAGFARHATGRDARHQSGGRQSSRRRHRQRGLHRRHRWQPCHAPRPAWPFIRRDSKSSPRCVTEPLASGNAIAQRSAMTTARSTVPARRR